MTAFSTRGYPDPSYAKRGDRQLFAAVKRIRHWLAAGFHLASRVELAADLELLLERCEANAALTTRLHRRTQAAEAGLRDTVADCRRQGLSLGRRLANSAFAAVSTECERISARLNEANQTVAAQRRWIEDLQSGQWVNCVFCGHRYIPREASPTDPTALLRSHIASCAKHPLHETREALLELYAWAHELQRFAHHMPDGGAAMQESIDRAKRALADTEPGPDPAMAHMDRARRHLAAAGIPAAAHLDATPTTTTTEGNPS